VYRARPLNREIAIKVSKAQFTERFTREAGDAALNHTDICHLYDLGPDYLVMEYVAAILSTARGLFCEIRRLSPLVQTMGKLGSLRTCSACQRWRRS